MPSKKEKSFLKQPKFFVDDLKLSCYLAALLVEDLIATIFTTIIFFSMMSSSDWVGSVGVFITLLAYFLIIFNFIPKDGKLFYIMNIVGAGLACYASVLIHYWPFIILEGSWTFISLLGLLKVTR